MSTRVIRANESHLDVLTELFNGYRVFYRQSTDLPRARAFIADRLRSEDSVIFLALIQGDVAAGFTQLYPSFSSVRTQRIWILNDLFVDTRYRVRGVGRALIQAAHRHAIETGAASVSLSTEKTNTTAKALYQKLGYTPVTAFEQYTFAVTPRTE